MSATRRSFSWAEAALRTTFTGRGEDLPGVFEGLKETHASISESSIWSAKGTQVIGEIGRFSSDPPGCGGQSCSASHDFEPQRGQDEAEVSLQMAQPEQASSLPGVFAELSRPRISEPVDSFWDAARLRVGSWSDLGSGGVNMGCGCVNSSTNEADDDFQALRLRSQEESDWTGLGVPKHQTGIWTGHLPILPCEKVTAAMINGGLVAFDATVHSRPAYDRAFNHEFIPYPSGMVASTFSLGKDPVGVRLMLAISYNGVDWIKTGMVIANHSSVPCLAVEENEDGVETLYLFFCTARENAYHWYNYLDHHPVGNRPTPLAVAYTTDLVAWTYRFLDCADAGFTYVEVFDEYHQPLNDYCANDPSVVRSLPVQIGDQEFPRKYEWLMYYTLHYKTKANTDAAAVLVARADHLYDFTWTTINDGLRVLPPFDAPADSSAEDPTASPVDFSFLNFEGGYRLFAGGNAAGETWSAGVDASGTEVRSWTDHAYFCSAGHGVPITSLYSPILMNNAIDAPGTSLHKTWIAATGPEGYKKIISVAVRADGQIESGTLATGGCNLPLIEQDRDYECKGIREAAVARFGGCWVMVYVTGIDGSNKCAEPPRILSP